ncbi:MAG: hypothetical protein WCX31_20385 [Salinivirgaceae bacterium]
MKTSRLNRVAGIFLALIVTAQVAVSSTNLDNKDQNKTHQVSCINSISGLTEYQKERIIAIEQQNQTIMNDLREKRQSASGKTQKEDIKNQMEKQVESYEFAIKALLSADQQLQFDQYQKNATTKKSSSQNQGGGKGKGGGKGNGQKC